MKRMFDLAVTAALAGMLVFSVDAFAAKGGGGGGGGKPGGETAAQNLSVPAILVGPLGTLACGEDELTPSALVKPTGTPLTGYELTGDWWVQKVHTWQAQCFNAGTAIVYGNWGDNIEGGDAKLTTGAPIRVEIVLTSSDPDLGSLSMDGYNVLKLQPSALDRLSAYGHDAVFDEEAGVWVATEDQFVSAQWVVHDADMQIEIFNAVTGAEAVPLQAIAPEINASGKIVYGYNLRVTEAGTYTIHFIAPNVTFTGCDAGECVEGSSEASIDIVVTAKNTGGGGGGGKPNR